MTDYFIEVLEVPESDMYIYFSLTCITAPIAGAVCSGVIATMFGGYRSKYALPSCIVASFITCLLALPVPFFDNFLYIIFSIWWMLFFGGYILPIVTGVMLTTVKADLRPQANSLANLSYNLLGYLPSPAIYGTLCNMTGGRKSRWGMMMLMDTTVLAWVFLVFAYLTMEVKTEKQVELEEKEEAEAMDVTSFIDQRNAGMSIGLEASILGIGMTRSNKQAS